MHPSTNASSTEFEMTTPSSCRNGQLYASLSQVYSSRHLFLQCDIVFDPVATFMLQNEPYVRVQPSSWVTWVSADEQERFCSRPAFVADHQRHELMRNGLLPRLDTMQLMHMQVETKRTKLEVSG